MLFGVWFNIFHYSLLNNSFTTLRGKDNGEKINGGTTPQDLIDMNRVNPWSTLSVICRTSLVEAVINFVESDSFEDCLRTGYKYLSDTDTISAIAAPMATIFYKDISVRDP